MPVVKIDALKSLAAAIAAGVPAFADATKIAIQQAPSAVIETFPNVSIIAPARWQYEPAQRLFSQDLGGGAVVWNIGAHEAPIQIRITAPTTLDRGTLEQQMINLLTSREGSPGVLPISIVSSDLVRWLAAFEYEDSLWDDTRAQEREYESVITCNAIVPALAVTTGVNEIDTLILGLTENMIGSFAPTAFVKPPPPGLELVTINQDGSIDPVS